MTPCILIHGGGFDRRCWELLLPHLDGPALAVDLPGRGEHPAPLPSVTLASCADSVVDDIDAAGFDEVVLVGHSLAGCSIPSVAARLGPRLRHVVFIACTVPPDGQSAFDTLDPEIQTLIAATGPESEPIVMTEEIARLVLGNDLDDDQFRWCRERLVPEAIQLTTGTVSLAGLDGVPGTWLRTMLDEIVDPDKQSQFAANLFQCDIVDIDAGHMCMVSRPEEVARIIRRSAP